MRATMRMSLVGLAGASALAIGGAGLAQQPGVTDVAPVNVGATPVPQIGTPTRMYTALELRMMDSDAGALRNRFEDERAEIDNCYQRAFGVGPNYERVDGYIQGVEAARKLSVAIGEAEKATEAMERIRSDVSQGKATQAQLDVAELARQAAIRRVETANREVEEAKYRIIDVQELSQNATPISGWAGVISTNAAERAGRKNLNIPRSVEDLTLTDIRTVLRGEGAAAYLYVTGKINNTGRSRVSIPALLFTAQDSSGRVLKTESVSAPGRIEPGQSTPFTFPFKPGLVGAARVAVTFEAVSRQPTLMPASSDVVCTSGTAAPQALNPRSNNTTRLATPSARSNQLESPETVVGPNGQNQAATARPTMGPGGGQGGR